MKRLVYILFVVVLAGCTFDDVRDFNPDLSLMFQPEMLMHVADDDVESFPTEQSFGVKAWALPVGDSWERNCQNAEEFIELSEVKSKEVLITDTSLQLTVKDTLWTFDEPIMWPTIFENLTFMAFSPYMEGCDCSVENGVTFSMNTKEQQIDMLYTYPNADKHKINNGWVVPLHFEHALCRVDFRVKHRVADNEKITLKRVTLGALHCKGEFNSLPEPTWSLDNELSKVDFFVGNYQVAKLPQEVGEYKFVIPQKLNTTVTVIYDYTTASGTTITQTLETPLMQTELKAGNSYTYTLSIGIDDVKFLKELIID